MDYIKEIKSLNDFVRFGLLSEKMIDYLLRYDILDKPFIIVCENNRYEVRILNKFLYYYYAQLLELFNNQVVYASEEMNFSIDVKDRIYSFPDAKAVYMKIEKMPLLEHNKRNLSNLVYLKLCNLNAFCSYIGLKDEMLIDIVKYIKNIHLNDLDNKINYMYQFNVLDFRQVSQKIRAIELAEYKYDLRNLEQGFEKNVIHKFSLDKVNIDIWIGNYL